MSPSAALDGGAGDGTAATGLTLDEVWSTTEDSEEVAKLKERAKVVSLRRALATHVGRVMRLFREWDEDGDGTVSKSEFRLAMTSLVGQWGLDVTTADVENLFDSLDGDGSGVLDYAELKEMVRVERAAMAKAKASSRDFMTGSSRRASMRKMQLSEVLLSDGTTLQSALRDALVLHGKTPAELFAEWDADGSGTVSRDEVGLALANLGLGPPRVDEGNVDELFRQIDEDGSGMVSATELELGLKKHLEPVATPASDSAGVNELTGLYPNGLKQRLPLRSKAAPLPALHELDVVLDKPPVGSRVPQWVDPSKDATPDAVGTYAGIAPRSTAIDVGRLRAQMRGHDLGLNAQVTPRTGAALGRERPPAGFADKIRSLTSDVYSSTDLPAHLTQQYTHLSRTKAASMHRLGGGAANNKRGLPLSKSLPQLAQTGSIDGPTIKGATSPDADATGPAPASGRVPVPKRRKPIPWEKLLGSGDKADPLARFFPSPNIDHLLYAEEI